MIDLQSRQRFCALFKAKSIDLSPHDGLQSPRAVEDAWKTKILKSLQELELEEQTTFTTHDLGPRGESINVLLSDIADWLSKSVGL